MTFFKVKNIDEAIKLRQKYPEAILFCGGSDLTMKLNEQKIDAIIDISSLKELHYIEKKSDIIHIGALTTINAILHNAEINLLLPLLRETAKNFASHQIRNIASLGGNIANASPVADFIAPLLVLESTVTLASVHGERTILLEELFDGYKSLKLHNEIIISFNIPLQKHQFYYRKVGTRATLSITKVSLAIVKNRDGLKISGASVNPYISRFYNLEKLLNTHIFNDEIIKEALENDISPSGSFRSTKEYRTHVLLNMIKEALIRFEL